MATKLYQTDLTFSEDYPYLVPVINPKDGTKGFPTKDIFIDIAIPITTSALNTTLGRGATAVIDKTTRKVDIPDLTDWLVSKLEVSGSVSGGITPTITYVGIQGALLPVGDEIIVWEDLSFSLSELQLESLSDGSTPDVIRVIIRLLINDSDVVQGEIITFSLNDELETDVFDIVENLAFGSETSTPSFKRIGNAEQS